MPTIVHYKGLENVLAAFEQMNGVAWALFTGKNLTTFSGSDADGEQLNAMLSTFNGGYNNLYTLRVYDHPFERFTDKLENAGSFNFHLADSQANPGGNIAGYIPGNLEKRIAAIEAGETSEKETTLERISGFVNDNPWLQPVIVGLIQKVLAAVPGLNNLPGMNAADNLTAAAVAGVSESDDKRIANAIALLKTKDSKLAEHLDKLSKMPIDTLDFLFKQLDAL